jgi:hypothetical protein
MAIKKKPNANGNPVMSSNAPLEHKPFTPVFTNKATGEQRTGLMQNGVTQDPFTDAELEQQKAVAENIKNIKIQNATDRAILEQGGQPQLPQTPNVMTDTTQTQTAQPEEKQNTLANIGLTPATWIGNQVTSGAEQIIGGAFSLATGKDVNAEGVFGRTTPQELSSTTTGKVLGLATLGTAATAAGVYGWEVGGSYLTSSSVPTLVKAGVARHTALTKIATTAVGVALGGRVISTPERIISKAKQAVSAGVQTINLNEQAVKDGQMTAYEANLQLDIIEQNFNNQERTIKRWGNLNLVNWLTGGSDNEIDILNAKKQLQLSRINLISLEQTAMLNKAKGLL